MYPTPENRMMVELFTVDHRITGYTTSRQTRLLDEMNTSTSALMLSDVTSTNLHGSLTQAMSISALRINKSAILFIIPHDDLDQSPRQRFYAYVAKKQVPLYFILPNFEMSGSAHFANVSMNIRDVLLELPGVNFTPITDVNISFLAKPHITMQAPVAGVNKSLIQAVGLKASLDFGYELRSWTGRMRFAPTSSGTNPPATA